MTIIDLGTVKIRFDPNDIRVSIDGNNIDIGARMNNDDMLVKEEFTQTLGVNKTIDAENNIITGYIKTVSPDHKRRYNKKFLTPVVEKELDKLEKKIRKTKMKHRPE